MTLVSMETRTFYALALGALAVAVVVIGSVATVVSFASAQAPDNVMAKAIRMRWGWEGDGQQDFKVVQAFPSINNGTINAGNEIMSKVKIDFVDAANSASKAAGGHVIGGDLTIANGYVVYSFRVISGDQEKNVIVDAGSGEVLHTSEAMQVDLLAELACRSQVFWCAGNRSI
jgi:uncharacterized membrane protein YkoI